MGDLNIDLLKPTYIDLSMNMLILFTLFPCYPLFTNQRESQLLQLFGFRSKHSTYMAIA